MTLDEAEELLVAMTPTGPAHRVIIVTSDQGDEQVALLAHGQQWYASMEDVFDGPPPVCPGGCGGTIADNLV